MRASPQSEDPLVQNGFRDPHHAERALESIEKQLEELYAVSAGIFGVNPNGVVRRTNENALLWPEIATKDIEDLLGSRFFTEVAPCTNNTLF